VALLLALSQGSGQAATIVVDELTCTIVDAIVAANADAAQGGCPAGRGADTLVLAPPGSTVTLRSVNNTTYGPTGLPVIRSVITIAGQGGTIARAPSAPDFRLLAVNRAGDLTLQDATLMGGSAADFSLVGWGAGILNDNGVVSIENSAITGNAGSGAGTRATDGGRTTVTLTKSTISHNSGTGVSNGVSSRDSYQGGPRLSLLPRA
jgi:hypothetical protein